LISISDDGSIRLWELRGSRVPRPGPKGSAGWNVEVFGGQQIAEFPGYRRNEDGEVTRGEFAAFSPYGHWLATAFQNKIAFRSPKDGTEQFSWSTSLPESTKVMAIRFDPNGNTLLAFAEHADRSAEQSVKFLQFDLDRRKEQAFVGTHGVVDGRA